MQDSESQKYSHWLSSSFCCAQSAQNPPLEPQFLRYSGTSNGCPLAAVSQLKWVSLWSSRRLSAFERVWGVSHRRQNRQWGGNRFIIGIFGQSRIDWISVRQSDQFPEKRARGGLWWFVVVLVSPLSLPPGRVPVSPTPLPCSIAGARALSSSGVKVLIHWNL